MEIKKITWEDKVAIEDLSDVEEINKVTAANINEIKDVVNSNGDFTTDEINKLQTALDETNTNVETANNGITTNASAIAGLEQKHTQQQSAIDTNTANISSLNTSVADIRNDINGINTSLNETNQKVNTKQDILTAGNGLQLLNNLISIQEQLLNKWNGYQTLIQTNQGDIATNTNEISTLQNDVNEISKLIQQIIEGLKQFPVFEIVGEWASGTAYRKNQAVYHNNKLWNSKINNNRTEPNESNTDWFLISKFDVDLSNYVTQNDLANALRLKQDVLTGTSGITISQQTNEIGIDNNLLTKWNGYENLIQANQTNINSIQNKADANESEINRINGIVVTNQTNITDLQNKTNSNQNNITANQTSITALENNYNRLNSEVVKIAGDQTITGKKTFTSPGEAIQIKPTSDTGGSYIAGYRGGVKKWVLGNTGSNDGILLEAPAGNIYLKPSQNASAKGYIDCYNAKLSRVANPTNNTDAATKQYVDSEIAKVNTSGGGGTVSQDILNQINANKAEIARVDGIVTNNSTNIVDLGNRTTNIENNYLKKNGTGLQQVSGNVDFLGDVIIKQKGYVDVVDPAANTSMTNVQYVKGLDATNVKLTTDQTINGTKTFTNQIIANQGLKTGLNQVITGADLELGLGSTFAYITPENGDAKALKFSGKQGRGKFDLDMGGASKITNLPEPINDQDAATKNYVDSEILKVNASGSIPQQTLDQINTNKTNITALQNTVNTNTNSINQLNQKDTQNVKLSGDQTINGTKTFTNQIVASQGITNLPDPVTTKDVATKNYVDTNAVLTFKNQTISGTKTFNGAVNISQGTLSTIDSATPLSLVNKRYVDRVDSKISTVDGNLTTLKQDIDTSLYTIYSTGNTIYNNLNKITTNIFNNSSVDYKKPLTVSFTRTNNSGTDYGSYTFQIQYGVGENIFVVGSNLYYDRGRTYGQLGDWVALTITPNYIQVQCWNGGDRVKNIKVQGWKKVIH